MRPSPKILLAALVLALATASGVPAAHAAPARVPVFLLVMDEFPGASIQDPQGGIDARRMPNLHSIARQATYYPNATTNSSLTIYSFPSFLSGQLWKGSAPPPRHTLFELLRRSHRVYHGEPMGDVQRLCSFCKYDDRPARRIFGVPAIGGDWQIRPIRSAYSDIRALGARATSRGRPAMWSSHIILPHIPYRFLPSGAQYPVTPQSRTPSETGPSGQLTTDTRLIASEQQRLLVQVSLTDRFIGLLRRQLTRAGLWERSMVILTSDHGNSAAPGTNRRGLEPGTSLPHTASIPLVVKYPGQGEARVDTGSAQLIDLLPTIAEVTGKRPTWPVDGLSLLRPRPERDVRAYANLAAGWRSEPFRDFVADRARIVKRWNTLFPGPAQTTWMGAPPSLRGRSVGALEPQGSPITAELSGAGMFRRVSRRSGIVPALVSGTLQGSSGGRPLAVAINGKVAAGGYSYAHRGEVRFNILVPEGDIRDGRNTVELFQMEDGRAARITIR